MSKVCEHYHDDDYGIGWFDESDTDWQYQMDYGHAFICVLMTLTGVPHE